MDNIGMKKDNFTYIKNTNKNEIKYKIFEHVEEEYADRILIFSKSIGHSIEFINFTNHIDKLVISKDHILYSALDKLLNNDFMIELPNEDVREDKSAKLVIVRDGEEIVMDFTDFSKNIVNRALIKNNTLKARMEEFFDELDNTFTRYQNDKYVYKLNYQKR